MRPILGAELPVVIDGGNLFHRAIAVEIHGAIAIIAGVGGAGNAPIEIERIHTAINIDSVGGAMCPAAPARTRGGFGCH